MVRAEWQCDGDCRADIEHIFAQSVHTRQSHERSNVTSATLTSRLALGTRGETSDDVFQFALINMVTKHSHNRFLIDAPEFSFIHSTIALNHI